MGSGCSRSSGSSSKKRERRKRIHDYRVQILNKANKTDPYKVVEVKEVKVLLRMMEGFPVPGILYLEDGGMLHANKVALELMGQDAVLGKMITTCMAFEKPITGYKDVVGEKGRAVNVVLKNDECYVMPSCTMEFGFPCLMYLTTLGTACEAGKGDQRSVGSELRNSLSPCMKSSAGSASSSKLSMCLKKVNRDAEMMRPRDLTIVIATDGDVIACTEAASSFLQVSKGDNFVELLEEKSRESFSDLMKNGEIYLNELSKDERMYSLQEVILFTVVAVENVQLPAEGAAHVIRVEEAEALSCRRKKNKLTFSSSSGISDEMTSALGIFTRCAVVVSPSGKILFMNEMMNIVTGYKLERVLFQQISLLVPHPYKDRHFEFLKSTFDKNAILKIGRERETALITSFGDILGIKLEVVEIVTPQNKVLYLATFATVAKHNRTDHLANIISACEADARNFETTPRATLGVGNYQSSSALSPRRAETLTRRKSCLSSSMKSPQSSPRNSAACSPRFSSQRSLSPKNSSRNSSPVRFS